MRLFGNFRFSFLRCCFAGLIHSQLCHQVNFFFFSGDILIKSLQPELNLSATLIIFWEDLRPDRWTPRAINIRLGFYPLRTIWRQLPNTTEFNFQWSLISKKKTLLFFQFWSAFKLIEISSFNNQFSSAAKILKGSNPNPKQSSKCDHLQLDLFICLN